MIGTLIDDVRISMRQLARHPGMTAVVLLTLALGTGSATAILTIVDRVLLRPLSFPDSGRLVALCETHPSIEGYCVGSPPDVEDWATQTRTLASLGLGRSWTFSMQTSGGAEGVRSGLATAGLFRTLGVKAAMGRVFTTDDVAESGRHVAVLSDDLWRTRFGADPGVLGRTVVMDGQSYAVIGVLPPRTDLPHMEGVRVWVPLPFDPRDEQNRAWRGFEVFGRLAPGATVERAQAELNSIQSGLGERFPATNRGWGARVVPLLDTVVGRVRPTLLVFLAAVGILLLVACANVANLMVARGATREKEFAVRAALGAGTWRLVRLVSLESMLLAIAGGMAGILLAVWATDAFLAMMPVGLPRMDEVHLDTRVLASAMALTLLAGLLSGIVPAWRASRLDLVEAIKEGHQPTAWRRALGVRGGLVIAEVAMAFVLAAGAGLLTHSYASLLHWEPGFDQQGILTFWTYGSSGKYPDARSAATAFARIEEQIRGIPGVTSVGMVSAGPLFGGGDGVGEFTTDDGTATPEAPIAANWYDMSPGYFRTLGVRLEHGRLFDDRDGPDVPRVVIVNRALARRYFGGADPVGRRLRMKNQQGLYAETMEIVGEVADIPPFVPGEQAQPEVYWPFRQSPRLASYFVLRISGDPAALVRLVDARLRALDPDMGAAQVATMADLIGAQLKRPRFNMLLVGVFAAMALTLTVVGVYGVIAASVAGRTRELGVRAALGAPRRRVLAMVMYEGMLLVLAGMALGAGAALAVSRFATSLLYGVRPTDPLTFVGIALLLATAAAAACLVPARRAARVDPMEALRAE